MKFSCLDVANAAGLTAGKTRGDEHAFLCPRHPDRDPSLKVNAKKDAFLCGPCGAKGTAYQLAAFLSGHPPDEKTAVNAWLRDHGLIGSNGQPADSSRRGEPKGTVDCRYQYRDEHGTLQYEVVRYRDPKDFRQRRPNGTGWIWKLDGVERVPYGLDRLADSAPDVFVTEGEQDADILWQQNIPATTNVCGAGNWRDEYSQRLVNAAGCVRAFILPDHDQPGHDHAQKVARSLHAAGVEVRVVSIPGLHDGAPPPAHGRDISDWLPLHSVDELRTIATTAPVWTPGSAMPAHWQRLDLAELDTWSCEPLQPIVDGLIARGNFVYVAAMTQTGKTLVSIHLACALVHGGNLFDRFAITPVDRLAYLVLEDPARRIQDRLRDMAHDFPIPTGRDRCVFYVAPGFTLTDDPFWLWLEDLITADRRDVIIIDTYQKATPGIASFDDEKQSRILHRLSDLTRRTGVTLIVIDHVRKQSNAPARRRADLLTIDDLKGTGGKAQNADCVILMERTADKRGIKFQAYSKDFDVPVRILLTVAPRGSTDPKFTYAGNLDELGDQSHTRAERRRAALLDATPCDWTTVPELAAKVGSSESTVKRDLKALLDRHQVEDNGALRQYRRWRRVSQPDATTV